MTHGSWVWTYLLAAILVVGLQGALYKPNMVGIRRDAPPEVSGPLSPSPSNEKESGPPPRPRVKPPQDLSVAPRGLGGSFPPEKSPTPRFSTQGVGAGRVSNGRPKSDNGYSQGLARSAPLAPPAGQAQPYLGDSYRGTPSQPEPGRNSPNGIIPVGYGNSKEPIQIPPKKPGPPALTSYNNKPNPFIDPRSSPANPYSPNALPASPPNTPSAGQSGQNAYFPQTNQGYQQPNPYQPNQQNQQQQQKQPTQGFQPYGPARPSDQGGNPSGKGQFNVPRTLSSNLGNPLPPPPGTNKIGGASSSLSGAPAFPAPFGFPESLKVGQNSPFKNLVSFNSPRPFKSRASAAFPDKGDIFGGFPSSNYENPVARPTPAAPESRPAVPASRPAYNVEYAEPVEPANPYAPATRGSGQDYRPQDPARFEARPAGNPYFTQPRSSNPGYELRTPRGGLYGNPYGYSNAPSGQCFRYTYAAEGYRLSDIAKSYPQDVIKKELEEKPYLAPLVGLKVSPKKQQAFNNFFQFDYSGFGFNNGQNDDTKYEYLLNSKVYPGNFKQGDFTGSYPSSMRPLDTSCPSQEYKLRSFFHHGGDCYVVNPEWQQITYNRCSRRECNFCGVNRGLSACVEDYRWFTVVAYCSKLKENSRIVPLRLILPVGCTCQHFAC